MAIYDTWVIRRFRKHSKTIEDLTAAANRRQDSNRLTSKRDSLDEREKNVARCKLIVHP